jgi:uncharacterized protein (TIGR00255 family)
MPISSMTGFARVEGALAPWSWYWEGKSVNGRGLELRFRLPPGLDLIEAELRQRASKFLKRGNIQISLTLKREAGSADISINRAALAAILSAVEEVRARAKLPAPDPAAILGIKGVIETGIETEEDADLIAARDAELLVSAEVLLASLAAARAAEGKGLASVLGDLTRRIGALAEAAADQASVQPEKLRERIKDQVRLLLDSAAGLTDERLAQELAMIAAKADVREEIDRLRVHVRSAEELLGQGAAVGRRLDFLSQEFNREANTICSKAADIALTKIGLELKAAIDQFREQVQNIE